MPAPYEFRPPWPPRAALIGPLRPPHAALIPIYWNLAWPVRLPLPIIPGINDRDVSLRWIRVKAGQVHLLNRDENEVITATTNTEDIVGWTADEILRTYMGVDDPTDDATAAAARELRQLRDEGPGDTVEAEERRQGRMQELRRLGGPGFAGRWP